jgi:glycosyltransferase involved in cell wall biosynthesis
MVTPYLPAIEHRPKAPKEARPVLLLMVYECAPEHGSEGCAGWGRVIEAAREFELHVIVSAGSFAAVERYLEANPIAGAVHFHTPTRDALGRLLKFLPRRFAHNAAYRHWQRLACRLASELHRTHCFSLVHQISPCDFREPGYTSWLGIPYIWGPVGGTENFPEAFLAGLPMVERLKERAHTFANLLYLRNRRVKTAAQRAAVLFAANSTSQRDFELAFRRPAELLIETALTSIHPPDPAKFQAPGPIHLLWSGEFTTRAALPLLLEALANLGHEVDYRLRVLGAGPREAEWKELARSLGLGGRCSFLGHVPIEHAIIQLEWAHLFVFTSLRDSSARMVLESLGQGVPVLCLDQHAAADIVTPACGIKLPVTYPAHVILAIADCIRALSKDRPRLLRLSTGASIRARNYLWSENGARINSIYRRLALAGRPSR